MSISVQFIRAVGRRTARIKFIGPRIYRLACKLISTGTIRSGIGAGLKFDATGGIPGYLLGTVDEPEQKALASLLKPGNVFYDIGANIGFYSTIAARIVGPEGHVYAFEPFPESAKAARGNASLNGFKNVSVIEFIVIEKCGTAHLAISSKSSANHFVADKGIEVSAVSIDHFVKNNRPPDVVMVDVEGEEIRVLNGMENTMKTSHPAILCEVHIGPKFLDYFKNRLEPLGYALTYLYEPISMRYHVMLQ